MDLDLKVPHLDAYARLQIRREDGRQRNGFETSLTGVVKECNASKNPIDQFHYRNDGRAIAALVNAVQPGLCLDSSVNPCYIVGHAMNLAEKYFKIPPVS